jgi:hypothetical protein
MLTYNMYPGYPIVDQPSTIPLLFRHCLGWIPWTPSAPLGHWARDRETFKEALKVRPLTIRRATAIVMEIWSYYLIAFLHACGMHVFASVCKG